MYLFYCPVLVKSLVHRQHYIIIYFCADKCHVKALGSTWRVISRKEWDPSERVLVGSECKRQIEKPSVANGLRARSLLKERIGDGSSWLTMWPLLLWQARTHSDPCSQSQATSANPSGLCKSLNSLEAGPYTYCSNECIWNFFPTGLNHSFLRFWD